MTHFLLHHQPLGVTELLQVSPQRSHVVHVSILSRPSYPGATHMPTLRPRQGSLRFRAKDGQVPDGSSFQKTSWPSRCPKGTCESHSATGASAHRPLNTDGEVACLFSFHFHFYSPAPPFCSRRRPSDPPTGSPGSAIGSPPSSGGRRQLTRALLVLAPPEAPCRSEVPYRELTGSQPGAKPWRHSKWPQRRR